MLAVITCTYDEKKRPVSRLDNLLYDQGTSRSILVFYLTFPKRM